MDLFFPTSLQRDRSAFEFGIRKVTDARASHVAMASVVVVMFASGLHWRRPTRRCPWSNVVLGFDKAEELRRPNFASQLELPRALPSWSRSRRVERTRHCSAEQCTRVATTAPALWCEQLAQGAFFCVLRCYCIPKISGTLLHLP